MIVQHFQPFCSPGDVRCVDEESRSMATRGCYLGRKRVKSAEARVGIRVPGGRNYSSPRSTTLSVHVTSCFARGTLSMNRHRNKLYAIGDVPGDLPPVTKGRFTLMHNRALSRPPARVCLLRPPTHLSVQTNIRNTADITRVLIFQYY